MEPGPYNSTNQKYSYISDGINKKDISRLATTADLASKSVHHRFRIGCTIWRKNTFLSAGVNTVKDSPDVPPGRRSIHAEVRALNNFKGPGERCTLYVIRLDAFSNCTLCKPCSFCIPRIINAGISRVVFSTYNGFDSFRIDMCDLYLAN